MRLLGQTLMAVVALPMLSALWLGYGIERVACAFADKLDATLTRLGPPRKRGATNKEPD